MANGAKLAMAVGAGYLLGRTRKMKLAFMIAAAGITGKFPARPTDLVAHGLKSVGASPDVSHLTHQLRGELLDAARAAALAAATSQVDALNNRLQGVTSAVGADEVLDDVGSTVGDTVDGVVGLGRKRARGEPDVDEEDFDDGDEADVYEADFEDDDDEADLDDLDEPEPEEEERPVARRRATRRTSAPRTARRTGRSAAQAEPAKTTNRAPVRRGR